jgi:TonB family protein
VAIRAAIERVVVYPRLARRQGIEGTVVVRFRVEDGGMPAELSVVQSVAGLDEAAVAAVRKAAPFRSGPGWVRVPIVFRP